MEFWSIAPRELRTTNASRPDLDPVSPERVARYRHPVTGEEWDGVGKQPDWLRQALIKEGYTVEEIRVA